MTQATTTTQEQKKPDTATVTFTLNGEKISVPKGWTVMQAAKSKNVAIPHFCWHPGLSIAGVCRFCMVKVEGRPKLEIACNLQAMDNMVVDTLSAEVKDAHKWALEFHLVNHPLDCPICDQAGECGLQDYYMEVGKYKSEMERPKVLKPKTVDVGKDLVLDTERCILCSRCVRFEEEITKTGALGIFDRGDRAIIGIYPGKKIEHNYTDNLVDICPVGAFTSKDFRFKQRVWFLKDKPSVCPGCSTGCHVNVFGKPETRHYYRLKPRESDVNGHWMCNFGRDMYKHLNPEKRLPGAYKADATNHETGYHKINIHDAFFEFQELLESQAAKDVALLISAQYTTEEYESLFQFFVKQKGIQQVFQWRDPSEKIDSFDGQLMRGDHNANTMGLKKVMEKFGIKQNIENGFTKCAQAKPKLVIAFAPEVPLTFPGLGDAYRQLSELKNVILFTLHRDAMKNKGFKLLIPTKGFTEKVGSFLNYQGKVGELNAPFLPAVQDARSITECVDSLSELNS